MNKTLDKKELLEKIRGQEDHYLKKLQDQMVQKVKLQKENSHFMLDIKAK
jgi:hypothetical protein